MSSQKIKCKGKIMNEETKYNLEVGLRIREVREALQQSRESFSESCGISTSFLADIERGKKSLTIKTLRSICEASNVSSDYIVFGHEKGFQNDIAIELIQSFDTEQMDTVIHILGQLKSLINKSK